MQASRLHSTKSGRKGQNRYTIIFRKVLNQSFCDSHRAGSLITFDGSKASFLCFSFSKLYSCLRLALPYKSYRLFYRILVVGQYIRPICGWCPMCPTKHTSPYAFSSTQQVHPQQHSRIPHGQDRDRQAAQHKPTPRKTTPNIHPWARTCQPGSWRHSP
jgi:hypothetical protein